MHTQLPLQQITRSKKFTFLTEPKVDQHFISLMPCDPPYGVELINPTGNAICADCISTSMTSAQINLGNVFCCLCAAIHRLMTHDPSVMLIWWSDTWVSNYILTLHQVGNSIANAFWKFARSNPQAMSRVEEFIRDKSVNQKWIDLIGKHPARCQDMPFCCSKLNQEFGHLSLECQWVREPMDLGSNRDHDSADFEWCVSSVMSGNHSFSH
jgi:hypothetical protein